MSKKILILCVLLSCLLTACGNTGASSNATFVGDREVPGVYSLDEYHEFIKTAHLPSNFIRYECISILGNFLQVIFDSWEDYSTAHYLLTDENNYWISLLIRPASKNTYDHPIVSNVSLEECKDMQKLTNGPYDHNFKIYRAGLYYHYGRDGSLMRITWQEGKNIILLSGASLLIDYPMDGKETIVSRLLSIDENVSKAAFEELKAHMKANS